MIYPYCSIDTRRDRCGISLKEIVTAQKYILYIYSANFLN